MPKLKTNRGAAKRFKKTASGGFKRGHAFHSHILKEMRPTARHYPMTLAETASIFGEHILAEGVYDGLTLGAEATFAAEGVDGQLRYDPMSLRPFISYPEGPYAAHWLEVIGAARQQPLFARAVAVDPVEVVRLEADVLGQEGRHVLAAIVGHLEPDSTAADHQTEHLAQVSSLQVSGRIPGVGVGARLRG